MKPMTESFEQWMDKVRAAFDLLNMPMADWQAIGAFDYRTEYDAGVKPAAAPGRLTATGGASGTSL